MSHNVRLLARFEGHLQGKFLNEARKAGKASKARKRMDKTPVPETAQWCF